MAHRAMLCHSLSLVSASLVKQELKVGLTVEEVAAAARSAYLAGPHERLGEAYSGRCCSSKRLRLQPVIRRWFTA